jgi:hypothetical protein
VDDAADTVMGCGARLTTNVTLAAPTAYVDVAAAVAVISHDPAAEKVITAVELFTVQPVVPALATA